MRRSPRSREATARTRRRVNLAGNRSAGRKIVWVAPRIAVTANHEVVVGIDLAVDTSKIFIDRQVI